MLCIAGIIYDKGYNVWVCLCSCSDLTLWNIEGFMEMSSNRGQWNMFLHIEGSEIVNQIIWTPFNIKMSSYQYRKSHCGDKTVVRSSYLYNGISYTGKMSSLYWIGAQGIDIYEKRYNVVYIKIPIGKLAALIVRLFQSSSQATSSMFSQKVWWRSSTKFG